MSMNYLPRLADRLIAEYLQTAGAVLIEGPRYSGKTKTASQFAASQVYMDEELRDSSPQLREVLEGEAPRLIDEWQIAPKLWNLVRREVDQRNLPGQFILTGSASPEPDAKRHTGAGRFQRFKMRTMSVVETGYSNGAISLADLFEGTAKSVSSEFSFEKLLSEVIRGGWPGFQTLTPAQAIGRSISYLKDTALNDYSLVDSSVRDPERILALIRSIARNTGSEKNMRLFASDLGTPGAPTHDTIERYFEILNRLHLVDLVPGSSWQLRSKATMRSKPRVYLADPSLAVAALGASPEKLKSDLNTLGFLYENLVIRDLITFMQLEGGTVEYYRDSSDLEVDAIIKLWDSRWAAIEIKLGESATDKGAESLKKLVAKLDPEQSKPEFLAVITNGNTSYQRGDGVWVIALHHLAP